MKREWRAGDVARVNGSIAVRTDDNVSWWTTSVVHVLSPGVEVDQ